MSIKLKFNFSHVRASVWVLQCSKHGIWYWQSFQFVQQHAQFRWVNSNVFMVDCVWSSFFPQSHAWFIFRSFVSKEKLVIAHGLHVPWSEKKLQLVSVFFSFVHPCLVSYLLWYLYLFSCFKQYLPLQNSQNSEHQKIILWNVIVLRENSK